MNIINLTPHPVILVQGDNTLTIEPSGTVARVQERQANIGSLDLGNAISIPLVTKVYGDVEGVGAPQADTIYIVSSMVKARCPERYDVLAPADLVRDAKGAVVGAQALAVSL